MARYTRVTFFQDDDLTPIDGVGITTCSTDPTHARPFLRPNGEHAESEVNFSEGRSVIGQINLVIQDNRRTATDQDTGWFTQFMRHPTTFDNRLMGRRCQVEEQAENGTYYTIFDGVVQSIKLNSDLVSYNVSLRDIRERERRMRSFMNASTAVIWPERGLTVDYGRLPAGSQRTHLIKATTATKAGTYNVVAGTYGYVTLTAPPYYEHLGSDEDHYIRKIITQYGRYNHSSTGEYTHPYCRVRWRPTAGGAWKELKAMPKVPDDLRTPQGGFYGSIFGYRTWEDYGPSSGNDEVKIKYRLLYVYMAGPTADLPTNGQSIEVQVLSDMAPNEFAPLYIEETFGQLLKNIYDGVYSPTFEGKVRYNATAMNDLVTSTPIARVVLTEPVEDMRAWTEENIYKPLGMAPAINEAGEVVPIKYDLPDGTVSLVTLNDNNTVSAEWEHGVDNAITKVVFKYKRDFLKPSRPNANTDLLRFTSMDVTHEHIDAAAGIMGIRPATYEPVTVRDVTSNEDGYSQDANSEIGSALARERAYGILDRFRYGGQKISAKCRRSDTGVAGLKVGDWVLVGVSWLPDYVTGERGANRLAQVIKIKSFDHTFRQLTLLDAGASATPLGQPTLGVITQANGVVSVPVTALPAGGSADIEYAIAAAQPSTSSGDWTFLGRATTVSTLKTPTIPSGATVWVRARGNGIGKRPSAWTNAVSIAVSIVPRPTGLSVVLDSNYAPVVGILPNQHMLGARIYYVVYNDGATPPAYSAYVDASTPVGVTTSVTMPITVAQRQHVKVKVVGYPGFSLGAVTGAAGSDAETSAFHEDAVIPSLPIVKPVASETATDGTLTLEITDPQKRVTKVEFATQSGTGAMSAYVQDSVAPYSTTVPLVEKQISQIAYKVWGYDELGVDKVLAQDIIPYHAGARPAIPTVQTMSFDGAGVLSVVVAGDSDTASFKAEVKIGSEPTLTEIRAIAATNGRAGTFIFSGPFAVGAEVHVGVLAYSGTGATGLESITAGRGKMVRPNSGTGTNADAPKAFITPNSETETNISLDYAGALGTGGTGPLQYRRRIDVSGVEGIWSAYAAFPLGGGTYAEETITKSKKYTKEVVLQTKDASGVESDYAHWTVYGQNESVAPGTGRLAPSVPMDISGWLPFGRGGDTAADVVMTTARYFTHSDQLDGTDLRVTGVKRGATNAEPVGNLFKRGSDLASDIVMTPDRYFVNSDQMDAADLRVTKVKRGAVTTEPTTNLLKQVTDAVYPSQFQAGYVDVQLTYRAWQHFARGFAVSDAVGQTLNAGVMTEASANILNIGGNDDLSNRFGGTYTAAQQGGFLRVDFRTGQPLFAFYGRAAGSTGGVALLASLSSSGDWGAAGHMLVGAGKRLNLTNPSGGNGSYIQDIGAGAASVVALQPGGATGYGLIATASGGTLYGAWMTKGRHFIDEAVGSGALQFRRSDTLATQGYVYWEAGYIGFLNDTAGWSVRCNHGASYGGTLYGSWTVTGALSFPGSGAGQQRIYMGSVTVVDRDTTSGLLTLTNNAGGIDIGNSGGTQRLLGAWKTTGAHTFDSHLHLTANTTYLVSSDTNIMQILANGANLHGVWSLYNGGTPRLVAGCIPVTTFDNALTAPEGTFQAVYTP